MGDGRTQTTLSFYLCPLTPDPTAFPQVSSLVYSSQHTCRSLWNIHDHDVSSINFINCFVLINNSKLSIYIVMGMPILCAYIHIYLHIHIHLHMYIYTHAPTYIHRHTCKHTYIHRNTHINIYIERDSQTTHTYTFLCIHTHRHTHTAWGIKIIKPARDREDMK